MSLNIVMGYCGLFTLAHAGYFAIGAYTYAIASLHGVGFFPAMILAMLVSSLLSLLVSLPAWRLKGDYLVLLSLATQSLISSVLYNWYDPASKPGSIANLTNGPFGIAGLPRPVIFGIRLASQESIVVVAVIVALCCGLLVWLLVSSPWGRLLQCQRDDELAARSLGKNVRLVKVQAFAISCGLVAVAGVIYAAYVTYIDASTASLDASILMACMVIVGGLGNFRGPLIGALVLLAVPEALRFVHMPDVYAFNVRLLVYGLLLVVMMHVRPQGLAGKYRFE
jgi:branched-chain amino acid transport system permease protein